MLRMLTQGLPNIRYGKDRLPIGPDRRQVLSALHRLWPRYHYCHYRQPGGMRIARFIGRDMAMMGGTVRSGCHGVCRTLENDSESQPAASHGPAISAGSPESVCHAFWGPAEPE